MAEATTLRLAPFCSALHGRSDAFDLFENEKEAITQVPYGVLRCRIPLTFLIHSAYTPHTLFSHSSYSVAAFRIFCCKHSLFVALHM